MTVPGNESDLIWDDSLNLNYSKSEVVKFLGNEHYQYAIEAIYAGLGIPEHMLRGRSDNGSTIRSQRISRGSIPLDSTPNEGQD